MGTRNGQFFVDLNISGRNSRNVGFYQAQGFPGSHGFVSSSSKAKRTDRGIGGYIHFHLRSSTARLNGSRFVAAKRYRRYQIEVFALYGNFTARFGGVRRDIGDGRQ